MSKLFLIDGFVIIKLWAVGFFGFHISGIIHILPALTTIALLLAILCNKFSKR